MRTAVRYAWWLRFVRTGVLLAGMTACTTAHISADPCPLVLPLSNRQVAEQVVSRALENLGIPEGNGREVSCRIERTGRAGDTLLDIMAVEYLLRRGYRVRAGDTVPGFTFRADSLMVDLERRGGIRSGRVVRRAEAFVVAVFRETADAHTTYRARGVHEDAFPSRLLAHAGRVEPFVNESGSPAFAVKQVLFGLIVTGLIWLLYSYRG
jgi:hypothetical protein